MNDINLGSEHLARYQARLKHIDDLIERAKKSKTSEYKTELKELKTKREELASHFDEMQLKDLEHWKEEEIEKSGPMGVWDAVAQQLETLVEKVEKK